MGKLVLLVEDSPTQAMQTKRVLEQGGYLVRVARDGMEAMEFLARDLPSIIISDIRMPEMDGYELCRTVKGDPRLRGVPLILLTSFTAPEDVLNSLAAGADGFVYKALSKDDLLAFINNWLSKETAQAGKRQKPVRFDYNGFTYNIPAAYDYILHFLVNTYQMVIRHTMELERLRSDLERANTDLARNLAELQASEDRFEGLVMTIPDIVYRIDVEGRFVLINDAVARLGYAPGELAGRHFSELIAPLDGDPISRDSLLPRYAGQTTGPERAPQLVDERRTGDRKTTGLVVGLRAKGDRPVEPGLLTILEGHAPVAEINSAGLYEFYPKAQKRVFVGSVGVIRDITARRCMEVQLQESRDNLEQKVLERTKDLNAANAALIQEITEHRKTELDLRESQANYRSLFECATDGILLLDLETLRFKNANRAVSSMLGYSQDEILGLGMADIHPAESLAAVDEIFQKQLRGEVALAPDIPVQRKDGSVFYADVSASLLELGGSPHVIGIFRDTTERRRAERDIRESEELLKAILAGIQAAVFYVDPAQYHITNVNPVGEKLLGLPRERIVGAHCCDLICPDKKAVSGRVCPACAQVILDKEGKLTLGNGRVIPVSKSVLPARIRGKDHLVEILFDLSERKSLERQLALAQKLEAVGQLAAGIAHEINTPVQYIGGNINYFEQVIPRLAKVVGAYADLGSIVLSGGDAKPAAQGARELMEESQLPHLLEDLPLAIADCKDGVQRITTIVQAMKRFSHPDAETRKPVDVNAAIQNTITISRNEWKYASEMVADLAPDLPMVQGFPGDFNQVLLNMLVNAAQANAAKFKDRAEKGRITVSTRREGDQVLVSVADTGVGIPEENRDKIFDPFFTTKDVGEGTGQGLAITHAIVQRHGGAITFTSTVGIGTTFTVALPMEAPRDKEDAAQGKEEAEGGSAT